MFNFLLGFFRKCQKPKANGHDHGCNSAAEIPPEVIEIRRRKAQARTKSDHAETQLEKTQNNHRATVFQANQTFSGLAASEAEQKQLDIMKAKWLEENKQSGAAPA